MIGIKQFWHPLNTGLQQIGRYWQILLITWGLNLALAMLLALIPALNLIPFAYRPAIDKAAKGINLGLIMEIALQPHLALEGSGAEFAISESLQSILTQGSLIFIFTVPLAGLSAAFLRGGLLLTYFERQPRFRGRRFLWGCWHWFGAFILQGIIQLLSGIVLFGVLIFIGILSSLWLGASIVWLFLGLLLLLSLYWLALWELTSTFAVTNNTRNIFQTFWQAIIYLFRYPHHWLSLYVPVLLFLLLGHIVYRYALSPFLALDKWWVLLCIQQLFILWRLGNRLLRYAGNIIITSKVEIKVEVIE